ncbi:hypothetical protein K7X08_009691 [Anisodus acutangulus]|uniref:Protein DETOXIFICATION n=1 Tax=Anisodus acutangulus TaxID=402998 RepID=A0A9Q1N0A5_9SOLA|nr:hypothetical protein K7X08_009691 [Anisodus acutangulus]
MVRVLIYNGTYPYWSTGNWSENAFVGVPEMTIPYIYNFHFIAPFAPMASFGYSEVPLETGMPPPLTRFIVDFNGQIKQFTWIQQAQSWNMFWSQPENLCSTYGLCGNLGFCNSKSLNPCKCLPGFRPLDGDSWDAGDFSGGCRLKSNEVCSKNDGFEEVGMVGYDGARVVSIKGTRSECEKNCLGGRRNVEAPPSARGEKGGGTEEKWFFPPWAARKIVEGNIESVIDERLCGTYNVIEAERVGLIAIWKEVFTKSATIEGDKDNGQKRAEGGYSALSPTEKFVTLEMETPSGSGGETPIYDGSSMEQTELHSAPSAMLEDYPPVQGFQDLKNLIGMESGKLWTIAGPIAFNILCMGSALETLCGQAFGAGQIELLGVYLQRSWIILTASCFCIMPLYIFSTPILKLLGQRDDIAELAGKFSIQIIPQMFSLAINFPTQKFLQAQSNVAILAWVGFMALIMHIGVLFLFIRVFRWGVTGAAAAYDVSAWVIALAQVVYIVGWCKDSWKGLSWLALKELWPFVKLSVASAVMICLEIWYFMTIIVLTGHLEDPVISVGSLSICMNLNGWEGMLFIGINAAVSVRVSNELGSGHPRAAKYSVFITVAESLLIGIFCMVLIILTKDHFALLFTSSEKMQNAVSKLAYLLAVTMLLNSVQPVISGVAVGGGWQALVAYINLACYYVIGLPLGFLLGYKTRLGVQGIWMGMIFGTFLQTVILCIIVYKTNWNDEVAHASERLRKWSGISDESETK